MITAGRLRRIAATTYSNPDKTDDALRQALCDAADEIEVLRNRTPDTDGCEIVALLKSLGATSCDGDCSVQALIPLRDGRMMRFAVTDDDVAETPGLWVDFYGRWDGQKFEYKEQQNPIL